MVWQYHVCTLGWWFSPRELWGYWLVHIVVPPMRLQTPSAPWVLSLAPSLGTLCSVQWMAVSIQFCIYQALAEPLRRQQQALVGIHNSVWVWWLFMGWIPRWGSLWIVISSVSTPYFVSVTPSMGILFPFLSRIKVSTLWSSFFLSFMWCVNCILGILSFWANIHLTVSVYHVCSFVTGLPHSFLESLEERLNTKHTWQDTGTSDGFPSGQTLALYWALSFTRDAESIEQGGS